MSAIFPPVSAYAGQICCVGGESNPDREAISLTHSATELPTHLLIPIDPFVFLCAFAGQKPASRSDPPSFSMQGRISIESIILAFVDFGPPMLRSRHHAARSVYFSLDATVLVSGALSLVIS